MGGRDRPASSTEISAPFWRETVKKRRRPSSDETLTPRDELAGFCGARGKARRPTSWRALVPRLKGRPCVCRARDDETTPTLSGLADRRRRPRDGRRGVAIPLLVGASRVGRYLFLKTNDRLTSGFRHGASSSKAGELLGIEGLQAARRTRTTGREFGPTTATPTTSLTHPNPRSNSFASLTHPNPRSSRSPPASTASLA